MNTSLLDALREDGNGTGQLRNLLNHIIGNETRKGSAITAGVLPLLSNLLRTTANTDPNGSFLLTASIVNILAHEGPSFVGPILDSELVPILLDRLSHAKSISEETAILKCLNEIAANLPSKAAGQWPQDSRLTDHVYDRRVVNSLVQRVLKAPSSVRDLILCLICRTCKTERQKQSLVKAGLLATLAQQLATFIRTEGLCPPSVESLDFPPPVPVSAPSRAHISPVLETIALLLEDSPERIELFLDDSQITAVLPQPRTEPAETRQSLWSNAVFSGSSLNRPRYRNPFDALLPDSPLKEKTNSPNNLNFPPLGSGGPVARRRSSFHPSTGLGSSLNIIPESQDEKDERTIVPFLLFLARDSKGKRRFLACKLLVILTTQKRISTPRHRSFAGLLVPMLVQLLHHDPAFHAEARASRPLLCDGMPYSKAVPAVLAELIRDDPELQKVAVEAKAIHKLSVSLRSTFTASLDRKPRSWRPHRSTGTEMQLSSPDCILGHGGPSRRLRTEMTYREGALRALAAIAPFDDDYRKQICDQGVLAEIIISMEPYDTTFNAANEAVIGNSIATILAACGAVRALTRSVTALRTKLVDAEVAKTVIKLMNSTDLEVRIAATKVLTNLAMDFSPMKESVGDSSVVKKLCEQAHSANARLRLESIWALKQLVVKAPTKLKQEVVNELGPSWIKLLIRTDPYDIPEGEVIGLVDKDYPPKSRYAETSDDVVMSEDSDGEDSDFADANSEYMPDADDFDRHTPEDDLAIQEQVLDLIRNLFVVSPNSETAADLVDYVLQEMGQVEFFQIMKARLSPKTMYGPTRKDNHIASPPPGVVTRVLYIILHIAACSQKWRMVITSEHELLKRILSFTSHAEREVRANCCWLAINLMFEDEVSDRPSCRRRATELSKLGYRMQLQKLENDADLDVRERAKTAMTLFATLLDQR